MFWATLDLVSQQDVMHWVFNVVMFWRVSKFVKMEGLMGYLADTFSYLIDLGGHAALMTAFGAVGYYFHGLEGRQNQAIQAKKEQILKNREALAALRQADGDEE